MHEDNLLDGKMSPDIEFYNKQQLHFIDVRFCAAANKHGAFREKQKKYENLPGINDAAIQIIPVIVGYDGIILKDSIILLHTHCPEVTPNRLYAEIYRSLAKEWV